MSISRSERKLSENETIFRRENEKVADGLQALDAMNIDDDNIDLVGGDELLIQFYCECSDENCRLRIPMKLADYQDIHQDRSQFIVVPGHEVDKIENTIHAEEQYKVVKKIHVVQEPVSKLNKTDIKNV